MFLVQAGDAPETALPLPGCEARREFEEYSAKVGVEALVELDVLHARIESSAATTTETPLHQLQIFQASRFELRNDCS